MTEQEAKEKWCPMVRVDTYNSGGIAGTNKSMSNGVLDEHKCIASACMMWIWREKFSGNEQVKPTNGCCGVRRKP